MAQKEGGRREQETSDGAEAAAAAAEAAPCAPFSRAPIHLLMWLYLAGGMSLDITLIALSVVARDRVPARPGSESPAAHLYRLGVAWGSIGLFMDGVVSAIVPLAVGYYADVATGREDGFTYAERAARSPRARAMLVGLCGGWGALSLLVWGLFVGLLTRVEGGYRDEMAPWVLALVYM